MQIIQCVQGTDEWLKARAGIVTASELDAIITPLWKPRTGEGVNTYLCRKLAERWLGMPLQTFSGGAMEQGKIREDEALPYYAFNNNVDLVRVGFITTDDGSFGCSPDAIIPGNPTRGIECKCPEPHTHMKYLLGGKLPDDYVQQVHGSIAVTGAAEWVFMSYCRNLPPFILPVKRDEEIVQKILGTVLTFNLALDTAYKRICELNGGPPDREQFMPGFMEDSLTPEERENVREFAGSK